MMKKIEALGKIIIVEALPVEEQATEGGLLIPEQAQKSVHMGTVHSVGSKVEQVSPGDRVAFKSIKQEYETPSGRLLSVHEDSLVYKEG